MKRERIHCPYCAKDYANQHNLAIHIQEKHPEKVDHLEEKEETTEVVLIDEETPTTSETPTMKKQEGPTELSTQEFEEEVVEEEPIEEPAEEEVEELSQTEQDNEWLKTFYKGKKEGNIYLRKNEAEQLFRIFKERINSKMQMNIRCNLSRRYVYTVLFRYTAKNLK